ncbi:AfsR/SARP family transcriptional regulator [Kutzneria sp. NPDC052558]|uniref:AfsR/SARP family transcriptional regulator n=1 Tax=Kutzneria sp. NPDC052558 TaxID=3364121 RepID=UPI0037CABA00
MDDDVGGPAITVRLLGEVQAFAGADPIDLGPPGPRSVLAVLALRANTTVSMDELISALWGDNPPRSAEGGIYTHVSALRKVLEPGRHRKDEPRVLASSRAGYSLLLPPGSVDTCRFEAAAAQARRCWAADDFPGALARCDDALGEWAGTALNGATGPFAEAERPRLELLKLDVSELRCAALVETGAADSAVATLTTLAAENPLRERLHELLMLALYRTGRQAEALDVYGRLRRRLVEELGVDPSPATRRMHEHVLAGEAAEPAAAEPVVAGRPARVVPAQLPHSISAFSGREDELRRLRQLCSETSGGTGGGSVVISAIDGTAGVGKTALAIRLAHEVAPSFPDGQLFVDLRGFDPHFSPVTPETALGHLLRSLGAHTDTQHGDLAAQSALYRSLLAGRRVLVVLDNAVSAEQVRPLLPGAKGCLALVTSRNRLAGLVSRDGATRISLTVLRPAESLQLLRRVLGAEHVDAELDQARELAELCGHLPLALRIAAERILGYEPYAIADMVDELRAERDRLDALSTPDDEPAVVRTVFSWSYHALKPEEARAFRLLGLHPAVEFGVAEAAVLLDTDPADARRQLLGLGQRHLLERVARDRYRFHDLLRIYAAECADRDETALTTGQAVQRLLNWCVGSTVAARDVLAPGLGPIAVDPPHPRHPPFAPRSYEEAFGWASQTLFTLVDVLRLAVDRGLDAGAATFAAALATLCHCTSRWTEWLRITEMGLAAARRSGDRLNQARLHNDMGVALHFLGRGVEGIPCHQAAVDILAGLSESGDGDDHAVAVNLAVAYQQMGRQVDAVPLLEDALAIARRWSNRFVEATVSDALGTVMADLGRYDEAIEHGTRCVELVREAKAEHMLGGHGLMHLGDSCLSAGLVDDAIRHYEEALELWGRLGDPWGEVRSKHALARALVQAGRTDRARELLANAVEVMRTTGYLAGNERAANEIRALLAELS